MVWARGHVLQAWAGRRFSELPTVLPEHATSHPERCTFEGTRKAPSLRRGHRQQEGPDYRFKAIRLVVRKPVASILYLFDPKAWVKLLQLSCRFKGNNTVVPNH